MWGAAWRVQLVKLCAMPGPQSCTLHCTLCYAAHLEVATWIDVKNSHHKGKSLSLCEWQMLTRPHVVIISPCILVFNRILYTWNYFSSIISQFFKCFYKRRNYLSCHLKKTRKRADQLKISRRKEILKIWAEVENRKTTEKYLWDQKLDL